MQCARVGDSLAGNEELNHEDVLAKGKPWLSRVDAICNSCFGIVENWDRIQELWGNQDIRAVAIVVENWLGAVEGSWSAGLVLGERGEGVELRRGVDDSRRLHG